MSAHFGQILLLVALGLFTLYVFRVRSVFTDRLIFLACALAGIILVIDPDLASRVAHWLGIGRGTDLLIYLFIIVALFYSVAITSELKKMKRQMTLIIRRMALDNPSEGPAGASPRQLTAASQSQDNPD